jgi:hypothetical protein
MRYVWRTEARIYVRNWRDSRVAIPEHRRRDAGTCWHGANQVSGRRVKALRREIRIRYDALIQARPELGPRTEPISPQTLNNRRRWTTLSPNSQRFDEAREARRASKSQGRAFKRAKSWAEKNLHLDPEEIFLGSAQIPEEAA